MLFALGDQFQAQGVARVGARAGAAIGIGASALCFWLVAPWFLEIDHFYHPAVLLFVLIGLIRPALSANLAISAIHHLGPTLAGTLGSIAPVFGAAFGILWLGEVLTWPVAFGTGGIMIAVAILARSGRQVGGQATNHWPTWALLLPVGAAAVRSLSHAVTKVGMIHIPDPYFAALVGFSVSAILTIGLQLAPKGGRLPLKGAGAAWFIASGVIFAIAVLSLNQALMTGDIVIIVPIIAAAPVFTMLLSVLVFRREKITARTFLALGLVVPSVVAVVIWG
jgi:drug/metabolite transporter, DME family